MNSLLKYAIILLLLLTLKAEAMEGNKADLESGEVPKQVVLRSKEEVESYSPVALHNVPNLKIFFLNDTLAGRLFLNLPNVTTLEIVEAKISDLLPITTSCTNLRSLRLAGCKFVTQLPRSISNLVNLEILDIQGTRIQSFHNLQFIPSLRMLYLNTNDSSLVDQIRKQNPMVQIVLPTY